MPLALSEVVDGLKKCSPEARVLVRVAGEDQPPTSIASWRGVYAEASFTREPLSKPPAEPQLDDPGKGFSSEYVPGGYYQPGHASCELPENPTVAQVITAIELCYGEEFEGYKGGQFTFDSDTPVWCAEYGSAAHNACYEVEDGVDVAVILTRDEEWDGW
jgi:hypothetical protein